MHHGARCRRRLAPAVRALPHAPVSLELPALRTAADGADEAGAPAKLHQMAGAGILVGEQRLELLE